jgi:hypothetical protein
MNSAYRSSKLVALLLALAFVVAPGDVRAGNSSLQFDGFYRCSIPTSAGAMTSYLRFYPDGVVVASVTPGTVPEVAKWMHRQHQANCHYTVRGGSIRFEEDLGTLSYTYSGTIRRDSLKLRVDGYSRKHSMGYVERSYTFVHVPALH